MSATEDFLAVINRLADNFRKMNRPDDRSGAYFALTLDELSRAVRTVKPHLDRDTASELWETYCDYTNMPSEEFENQSWRAGKYPYMEDLMVHLLEHMSTVASGGTRVAA